MGYSQFKIVDQAALQKFTDALTRGRSGPWGEDAVDFRKGRSWSSGDDIRALLPLPDRVVVDGVEETVWYDLHAKRD